MNRDPQAWKRLGRLMRDAREQAGLNRKDFADLAGVSEKAVYNAEKGDPPSRQQPPTLVKIAAGHGWKPESIQRILDGGEPILREQSAPAAPTPQSLAEHPDLAELMMRVHEFGRVCASLGGSREARDDFEAAAQRLFETVPRAARIAGREGYGLAAYRPHALGEGVPEDDAERILRAMEED